VKIADGRKPLFGCDAEWRTLLAICLSFPGQAETSSTRFMRYAAANDMAERNPVAEIRPADILKPRKKRNHPRVIAKERPNLLKAIESHLRNEHANVSGA
jgi:hypothetical protein